MEQTELQEMIHQAIKDIGQWIEDAPTPEVKQYRTELTAKILFSKRMHYYKDTMPGPFDSNKEYAIDE